MVKSFSIKSDDVVGKPRILLYREFRTAESGKTVRRAFPYRARAVNHYHSRVRPAALLAKRFPPCGDGSGGTVKVCFHPVWVKAFFIKKYERIIYMKEKLLKLQQEALEKLSQIKNEDILEKFRQEYLGKKGELTSVLRGMGQLSAEERPTIGQIANEVRTALENKLQEKRQELEDLKLQRKLISEKIDVTVPAKKIEIGKRHPLDQVETELCDIFRSMGFDIVEGPEVEYDVYNFQKLNIPENHPARDTQDTFYITDNVLLRSQTSPVQVRVMENRRPPIKIISPGRVYRADEVDATHSPTFHQLEGLVVDKGITMSNLKSVLETFAKKMFGENTKLRLRPHHFPFTEPSAEIDVSCFVCGGKGCRVCKNEGWIEILGAGMVHPNVLRECDIDPQIYSGFAFGCGIERITMIKYSIDDMRNLYENDMRFLNQF